MKRWISILIIAIIVIGTSVGGILGAREFYFKEETEETTTAEEGDQVSIHYIGWLEDERVYDGRRIFDTSYENIPNVKNPKHTLTYSERERGKPFNFTLGEGVIEGWNENVKGMEEGETKQFAVPPEKGYGPSSDELKINMSKTETVPVYEEIDSEKFQQKYGQPGLNMIIEDDFWGWDKTVVSITQESVKVRNDPNVGEVYHAYSDEGWNSKVVSIDTNANDGKGTIEIEHTITEPIVVSSGELAQHDDRFDGIGDLKRQLGQSSRGEGIVYSQGDQIYIDFNDEVTGKTLIFQVEIVKID